MGLLFRIKDLLQLQQILTFINFLTGRQFYKCGGSVCNFFLWADESQNNTLNNSRGPPGGVNSRGPSGGGGGVRGGGGDR